MANALESLQTLLRSGRTGAATSFVPGSDEDYDVMGIDKDPGRRLQYAQRRADITSGVDELLPGADSAEYRMMQAKNPGISREDFRSGDMGKLKQLLAMKQQEQESDLMTAVAGQSAAMDRVLAAQQGQNYRTEMQETGRDTRGEADRAAREAILEQRLAAMEAQQAARDAAAMERTQYTQGAIGERAQARQPKGLLDILRGFLPGGGDEATEQVEQPMETAAPTTSRRRVLSVR